MTFTPQTWYFPIVSILMNGTTLHPTVQLISRRALLDTSSTFLNPPYVPAM